MKKKLLFLSILLAGMPSAVMAQEFPLYGGKVKDGVLNVYLNTESFTPFRSVAEVEAIVVEGFTAINQSPTSFVHVNYLGRTTLSCSDTTDGVVVYCFKSKQDTLGGFGLAWSRTSGGLVTDGWVYLDSGFNFPRASLGRAFQHETIHILGLNHYDGARSIMGELPTSYSNTLTEYDIAALTYLYPFDLDKCEVTLSADFVLDLPQVWVGGVMYKASFQFNPVSNGFELKTVAIQEEPVSQCGYKYIESTGTMHLASVRYDSKVEAERGRYFLNLKLRPQNPYAASLPSPLLFEVTSFGLVSP